MIGEICIHVPIHIRINNKISLLLPGIVNTLVFYIKPIFRSNVHKMLVPIYTYKGRLDAVVHTHRLSSNFPRNITILPQ